MVISVSCDFGYGASTNMITLAVAYVASSTLVGGGAAKPPAQEKKTS